MAERKGFTPEQVAMLDSILEQNGLSAEDFECAMRSGYFDDVVKLIKKPAGREIITKKEAAVSHFCFLAGTKILMADGREKAIERIRDNDLVFTVNEQTKERTAGVVQGVYSFKVQEFCIITPSHLRVTDSHSLYARKPDGRQGWAVIDPDFAAQKNRFVLEIGDGLLTPDNTFILVKGIKRVKSCVRVFNLKEILPHHTFFTNGVLVHNLKPKGW